MALGWIPPSETQSYHKARISQCPVRFFPHVSLICQSPTREGIPVFHLQPNFWGHRLSLLIPSFFFLSSPVRIGTLFPICKSCWRIARLCLWQLCLAAIIRVCFIHNKRKRRSESQEISSGNFRGWRIGSWSGGFHCSCLTLHEHWEPVLNQQRAWEELSRLTVLTCLSYSTPNKLLPRVLPNTACLTGKGGAWALKKGLWVMGSTTAALALRPQLRGCLATFWHNAS